MPAVIARSVKLGTSYLPAARDRIVVLSILDNFQQGHAAAPGDGRTSLRHSEDADGCNALLDETPSEGGYRNGAARTRLQSHPCHEHYRHSAADSGNASIAKNHENGSHRYLGEF
jgi:hypothetical protein